MYQVSRTADVFVADTCFRLRTSRDWLQKLDRCTDRPTTWCADDIVIHWIYSLQNIPSCLKKPDP